MGDFWSSQYNNKYDPICDLVININEVYLIIEAKRDNVDSTSQVYNQVLNIINLTNNQIKSLDKSKHYDIVTPVDLNWKKLMKIATKVHSFESSFEKSNRFLTDFISLVRAHNFRWLPETPISYLNENDKHKIYRRIESAINEVEKSTSGINKLSYNDRLGITFPKPWAQEILFQINEHGDLIVAIYPGNTKGQGWSLFKENPVFEKSVNILGVDYSINKTYHIKFTSFQRYFTGLWFDEDELKGDLYTPNNFLKYTGRRKRGEEWSEIERLFNEYLDFDWKKECNWESLIINSLTT
jgi:hypothetical protein